METPPFQKGIVELDSIVDSLSGNERGLFRRLFHLSVVTGHLNPPETMRPWIRERFGSVEATLSQKIIRVTNLVTLEGAIFNSLRASRPIDAGRDLKGETAIFDEGGEDPLSHPEQNTPEDPFGRVEGKYCLSASNIAKYDGFHGMIIFKDRNPLHFSKEKIIDYIDTGWRWAEQAHKTDPSAKYFFFMWNCLWRAGASLIHGHAQVTLARDMHYSKVEGLRRAALSYEEKYGESYFHALYRIHHALGLGFERDGVQVLSYLTPLKEKEVLLMGNALDASLKEGIYQALACYRGRLGVSSFNLALYMPPLAPVKEDWKGFPVMVRLVDRGDPRNRASDIGAMELYAQSVIASDPFQVARVLKDSLGGAQE